MSVSRGGTFMKERPQVTPKSSEGDPPASNQPQGGGDLGTQSNTKSGTNKPDAGGANEPTTTSPAAPQVVPGKPDGEVDTRV